MRKRFRYDADLDAVIEIRAGSNYFDEPTQNGPSVISDDVGAGVNGLRHMPSGIHSDSKSFHYKETKARGLEHVGNETNFASKREHNDMGGADVKKAMEQIEGNWNGTRDWLRHRERQ
jgi:hypothetical protein